MFGKSLFARLAAWFMGRSSPATTPPPKPKHAPEPELPRWLRRSLAHQNRREYRAALRKRLREATRASHERIAREGIPLKYLHASARRAALAAA